MRVFPLPPEEWVGKQTCHICGGVPAFLEEDMKPICKNCINNLMVGVNKKESREEPSIPITIDVVKHTRFEWSIDGEKWYSLSGRNIKLDRPDIFLQELRKSVLESKPMLDIEADYDKETHTMSLLF